MQGLRYSAISSNANQVLALTGFKPAEFTQVCVHFGQKWHHYILHYTLEGKMRNRQVRKERANSQLPSLEDKLLFILYYLKNNPLQENLAVTFGLKQPHANFWLKLLRPRLEESLSALEVLPTRNSAQLVRKVSELERILIDGTERPIQRSLDYETQKEYYSGKKKDTVLKIF